MKIKDCYKIASGLPLHDAIEKHAVNGEWMYLNNTHGEDYLTLELDRSFECQAPNSDHFPVVLLEPGDILLSRKAPWSIVKSIASDCPAFYPHGRVLRRHYGCASPQVIPSWAIVVSATKIQWIMDNNGSATPALHPHVVLNYEFDPVPEDKSAKHGVLENLMDIKRLRKQTIVLYEQLYKALGHRLLNNLPLSKEEITNMTLPT